MGTNNEGDPRSKVDLKIALVAASNKLIEAKKIPPNGQTPEWQQQAMEHLLKLVTEPGSLEVLKELQNNGKM